MPARALRAAGLLCHFGGVATHDEPNPDEVAAGPFEQWLAQARASLLGDTGADVPCGDCVGCCVSSYHIPVRSTDSAALARIPSTWLISAAGMAPGQRMMGYRDDGTCPMLTDRKCTIYDDRPQTCRDYDCRIFAAAGIDAGDAEKDVINRRVRAWRFSYPTDADLQAHRAVLAAASFIQTKRGSFPGSRAPTAPTGIAVLALKVYSLFLNTGAGTDSRSDEDIARAVIQASRAFDLRSGLDAQAP